MPLEYYIDAIQQLQEQIRSLDQPIDCRLLRNYISVVWRAKEEYPEHFLLYEADPIYGCKGLQNNELVGVYLSNSLSPFTKD